MTVAALRAAEAGGLLPVTDAASSHVGKVRASNEDAFVIRPEAGLWAVADGMGGLARGEWASGVIVRALDDLRFTGAPRADQALLTDAIEAANAAVHGQAGAYGAAIGSTVVALLLRDGRFSVTWAGDSRAYRLRDDRLDQLTRDHTQVQDRVDRGLLTPAEARAHPMAHVLTRAVGVQAILELDSAEGAARTGDVFLLCSDGLHGVAGDDEIAAILRSGEPQSACDRLVALCLAKGAPDNVTVVVAAVEG